MPGGEKKLHVLFEHASGFACFKIREFEEENMFLAEVEESVRDYSRFSAIASLVGFSPFKTAQAALENLNSITEGVLPDDLKTFLAAHVLVKGNILGIVENKLAAAITETFPKLKVKIGPVVQEITRGIRTHFHKMVKGLTNEAGGKAQLGLGHAYSRSKIKFNVNRADNMIIQGIALLDQLDKDINTFSMRIREWYSYHFPELVKIVPDNYVYCKVVFYIKNRKELDESKLDDLEEIVGDSAKAKAVLDSSKSSMGMDISQIDLVNIEAFATRVINLAEYRRGLLTYLQSKMNSVAPNLTSLLGETVAARLIAKAGSLTSLAKYPASTVQILGAEKALFRALKTRGKTPKYGLLYHSTFIGRAGQEHKGRISRFLANKCTIASRIDCFTELPTNVFGEKLRGQVEERLKFYETGEVPRKNTEVMKEAMDESLSFSSSSLISEAKKKRKSKEMEPEVEAENIEPEVKTENDGAEKPKKKKKKKTGALESLNGSYVADGNAATDESVSPRKKMKMKTEEED